MNKTLAIDGGRPVRRAMLPYGRQCIDEADIRAVVAVLRSDWLTTGPAVEAFERAFAEFVGVDHAVAVSSGTAALHAAIYGLGIGPGDEVIVPPMTFAATANAVILQGATVVFADVQADTLLLDPARAEAKITPRTRAIIGVDYAGQPCDYDALGKIAGRHELAVIADASHALGATHVVGMSPQDRKVGSLADLNTFSFHPVKLITTGEGGMITTNRADLAERMRRFRNHCLTRDHRERNKADAWSYDVADLGLNYRLTDLQAALGSSQLEKLPGWIARRQAIAERYHRAFEAIAGIEPLAVRGGVSHAYHLYVIRLQADRLGADRATIFSALRAEGIGVNVHYRPVHLHPYYRERLGTGPGLCPVAEEAYERMISLPIFPSMTDEDADDVIRAVTKVLEAFSA